MTWSYCFHRRYRMSRQKNSILINEHALNREPDNFCDSSNIKLIQLLVYSQSELSAKIYWNSDRYFLHKSTFVVESVSFSLFYFVINFTSQFYSQVFSKWYYLYAMCHHAQMLGPDSGRTLCKCHITKSCSTRTCTM